MQNYIKQLIEDLEECAKNPPVPSYIEVPPQLEGNPEIAELALVPFKSIEELTGIKEQAFPDLLQLTVDQCRQVNEAIFKVYDTLRLELIDKPEEIPADVLYEALTFNWDYPVQYLPSDGMELELCTGDPEDCPYGEYCDCGEEFDEYEIPPQYTELLPGIADSIDTGLICYLNPKTLEIEEFPKDLMVDPEEYKMLTGCDKDDVEFKHENWEKCYVFEPLESNESFKIMEAFAEQLEDESFKGQLIYTLNKPKPFANFKWKIDNSPYRQNWFDFKQQWLEAHVKQIIFSEVNRISEEYAEILNGFFDDDGKKVDPESVPVPGLCIICKSYQEADWEENMLCLMNRSDQKNEENFECGAFQKL